MGISLPVVVRYLHLFHFAIVQIMMLPLQNIYISINLFTCLEILPFRNTFQ